MGDMDMGEFCEDMVKDWDEAFRVGLETAVFYSPGWLHYSSVEDPSIMISCDRCDGGIFGTMDLYGWDHTDICTRCAKVLQHPFLSKVVLWMPNTNQDGYVTLSDNSTQYRLDPDRRVSSVKALAKACKIDFFESMYILKLANMGVPNSNPECESISWRMLSYGKFGTRENLRCWLTSGELP